MDLKLQKCFVMWKFLDSGLKLDYSMLCKVWISTSQWLLFVCVCLVHRSSPGLGWNGRVGRQSRLSSSSSTTEEDGIFVNSASSKLLERAHDILMSVTPSGFNLRPHTESQINTLMVFCPIVNYRIIVSMVLFYSVLIMSTDMLEIERKFRLSVETSALFPRSLRSYQLWGAVL